MMYKSRLKEFIVQEMSMPRSKDIAKVYYHGTSSTFFGESIIKNGIKIPDLTLRKGKLKPVEGKVYITPHIAYAQIYCIGGDLAGNDYKPSEYELKNSGQYGYLFIIDGKDLKDIVPDEDSVGEILWHYLNNVDSKRYKLNSDLKWLDYLAQRKLTSLQYRNVKNQGDFGDLAVAGKKLVKFMTDKQKFEIIDRGGHIAHGGNLFPTQAWKCDKLKIKELKPDGSNFFKIAERVV